MGGKLTKGIPSNADTAGVASAVSDLKANIGKEDLKLAVFAEPVAGKVGSSCKAGTDGKRQECEGDDTCCAAGVPPACPMAARINDMWELDYKPRVEVCV